MLDGIKAVFVADVTAERVMRFLAKRRAGGLSTASSNHYLRAAKSFLDRLVRRDRATRNALTEVGTMNADTDRRHVRLALDVHELRALLAATADGPQCYGMSGAERALLYRVAVETGLRAGELRSLTRVSCDLDASEPTVTVAAGYSKRRRGRRRSGPERTTPPPPRTGPKAGPTTPRRGGRLGARRCNARAG